jgi:hypothetical protein
LGQSQPTALTLCPALSLPVAAQTERPPGFHLEPRMGESESSEGRVGQDAAGGI